MISIIINFIARRVIYVSTYMAKYNPIKSRPWNHSKIQTSKARPWNHQQNAGFRFLNPISEKPDHYQIDFPMVITVQCDWIIPIHWGMNNVLGISVPRRSCSHHQIIRILNQYFARSHPFRFTDLKMVSTLIFIWIVTAPETIIINTRNRRELSTALKSSTKNGCSYKPRR